jgi:hypothetical protein
VGQQTAARAFLDHRYIPSALRSASAAAVPGWRENFDARKSDGGQNWKQQSIGWRSAS